VPRAPEPARAILLGAVLALLVVFPLPFGSVGAGPVLFLELAAATVAAGAFLFLLRDPAALTARARGALLALALVVTVGIVQLLPLGTQAAAMDVPIEDSVPALPSLSLAPPDTVDALCRLLGLALLAFATAVIVRRESHARACAVAIAISGAWQGLYGSIEYLSGRQQIFGYVKTAYLECATGTFINRNHYAGYLALTLPFALGLLLHAAPLGRFWALFCIFCIWSGIVLSTSRGGMAAALLGALILFCGRMRQRGQVWLLLFALLLPTTFLAYQGLAQPGARFAELDRELADGGGRLAVWRAASQLALAAPWWGTGLGTFGSVFALVQPPSVLLRFQHAHNDWLQAAVEGGIPTVLAFLALLVILLWPSASTRIVGLGAGAAIAACALHALIDFSLRIPAVAALAAVVAGLRCSVGVAGDDARPS
jgi:hypothetical protein